MSIFGAMKKGLEIAAKSLMLCLVALVVLFVGYLIVGLVLGGSIMSSNFPPVTPDMSPEQVRALDWSKVNWGIFIPGAIIAFLLGFLLNSFTQGGIIASIRDHIKEGKSKVLSFFGSAVKYCLPLLLQILLIVAITVLVVIIALVIMGLVAAIKIVPIIIIIDAILFLALLAFLIYVAIVLVYGQISLVVNNSGAIKSLIQARAFLKKNMLKTVLLFLLSGLIYYVVYFALQLLTTLTGSWPAISRILWSLITSYIYIFASIFMVGSFITYYLATNKE